MSNWPLIASTQFEYIGGITGDGTLVTTGAANTKGSYATIGTSGFQYSHILLSALIEGSADRFRIDIAVNTGGSDQIVVEDYFIEGTSANTNPIYFELPLYIPSGATVKCRAQATGASRTISVIIVGFAQDHPKVPGFSRLRSLTDWTNTMPTNSVTQTGTTFSAWTQIMASTPVRVGFIMASPTTMGDTTRTTSTMLTEIGVGSAGNEVKIGAFVGRQNTSTLSGQTPGFPCDIPSGSRVAFRVQCAAAAADSYGVACMGLAA